MLVDVMSDKTLAVIRIITFLVGFLTVAWQILQAVTGNVSNAFFIPDLVVGVPLTLATLWPSTQTSFTIIELVWLIGLSSMSGIYLVASFGALSLGEYTDDVGPATTSIGLVVCIPCMVILSKRILQRVEGQGGSTKESNDDPNVDFPKP